MPVSLASCISAVIVQRDPILTASSITLAGFTNVPADERSSPARGGGADLPFTPDRLQRRHQHRRYEGHMQRRSRRRK
jgi:hypothetical protein